MPAAIYFNFKKNAKEAIDFYSDVFNTTPETMMFYSDMPKEEGFEMDEATKNLVMNARMNIHESTFMFSDVSEGMGIPLTLGNNITIVFNVEDAEFIDVEFAKLALKGQVIIPLGPTFWAKKYGYVIDQFGISWQYNVEN